MPNEYVDQSEGQAHAPRPSDVIDLGGADASVGLTYVFPLATVVSITSLAFHLKTAAGGGARQVVVQLTDGFGVLCFGVAAPGTQGGGLDVNYSFAPELVASGGSALGFQQGPFVNGRLPYNMSLAITVTGTSPNDVLTNGRLLVRQWATRHDYGIRVA